MTITRSSQRSCTIKNGVPWPIPVVSRACVFLKFRNFCSKIPVLVSLFNNVAGLQACNFIKKRLQQRCFSCRIWETFKNNYLEEYLFTTAYDYLLFTTICLSLVDENALVKLKSFCFMTKPHKWKTLDSMEKNLQNIFRKHIGKIKINSQRLPTVSFYKSISKLPIRFSVLVVFNDSILMGCPVHKFLS